MQMPSLAFAKLSLGPPILITSTTTQLVLNIICFINPINKLASIETGKYLGNTPATLERGVRGTRTPSKTVRIMPAR